MTNVKLVDMQMVQAFVTTAEERSMSSAAKRLGVTQSAISQSIRNLEEQFGVALLNRERRPLALTPAGLALRNRGVMLLNEIAHLKAQVIDASLGIKPDMRIGLVDSFAATCGSALIKEMLGRATTLAVRTGLTPYLGEALVARELDMVVSSDPLADMDGIVRRRLLAEQFLLITPRQQAGKLRTVKDIRDLTQTQPLVRLNRKSHLGAQIERFLRRVDVRAPHRLEVDNADTLTSMVAGGTGWAITTPMCLLQAGELAKQVKLHFLEGLTADRSIFLVARRDEYGRLFDETYGTVQLVLKTTLLPGLRAISPNLERLIELEKRTENE
jgi:DNA-binding transcriptional LysR family regulator